MEEKQEERKSFMKRKCGSYQLCVASYQDPLKKREEFAVTLRKKKTTEIINAKRRKLIGVYQQEPEASDLIHSCYKGYKKFEENKEEFQRQFQILCPELFTEAGASKPVVSESLSQV